MAPGSHSGTTAAEPLLEVDGLTVRLPGDMEREYAVKDVSFSLNKGEILCIVGESGSGKSVTANTIMGLLPKSIVVESGSIRFRGKDLPTLKENELRVLRGRSVSMIFQDPLSALNPLMPIGEQIAEVMEAHNVGTPRSRLEKATELLAEVGLPDPERIREQYPFRLSGGQRQRVMIAMALVLNPDILIADEPTTALDVTTQAQILELIRAIQRRKGMSVMFITHDFDVVSEIADRVVVMEKGLLVEQGPAAEVLNNPQHPYTQRLIAAVPRRGSRGAAVSNPTPSVLAVEHLMKTYHSGGGLFGGRRVVRAINDVSFTLHKGKTLGVVGESGSGKSSLGRALLKLIDVDSGVIRFNEHNIATLPEHDFRPLRPYIQMIFQDPFASLNPRRTIGQTLCAGPLAHAENPARARAKAEHLLDLVGLDKGAYDRFPHEFSGGQRQRIGIARALMFDPLILIADEAVSALDVSIQAQILALLADIQKNTEIAMIFITHDLRVAASICDDIIVMHKGRIVEHGPPDRVFNSPADEYTRSLIAAIPGRRQDEAMCNVA
ncbi:MAG: ABC transporter ATP-binding protein [Methylobacteriaceae bacterium]|jgi:peptide/nickel transport system ATP-binding protein|nr:ABC transporter ATP-binding protein [Methylobacteriaceae bacterium]